MNTPTRLLIVDDEDGIRFSLRGILEDEGHTIFEAATAEAGLAFLEAETVDLIFLDIWLPGMDGLAMLDIVHARYPSLPVLMISGHGTIETAVIAIKKGAHDFIEKPLSLEKVLIAVERALEFHALKRENSELREQLGNKTFSGPMGTSPVMVALREQISRVAPLDTWVLITGENGTGKELVARAVHGASRRKNKPLVALNCAAIPEELIESELFGHEKGAFTGADSAKIGKFEMAHQGTLFLDEIGDMSLKTQAKILRILQEKSFERVGGNKVVHTDVRVIAATNKDLESAISSGEFREDLYYRLRVFPLHVPPLRERGNDVLLLAEYLDATLAQDLGLTPVRFGSDAQKALLRYPWPGNVRELRNFLERMIILHGGSQIGVAELPPEFQVERRATLAGAGYNGLKSDFASGLPSPFGVHGAGRSGPARPGGTGGWAEQNEDAQRVEAIRSAAAGNAAAGQEDAESRAAMSGVDEGAEGEGAFTMSAEALSTDFKSARSAFEAHFLAAKLQEYDGNISRLAEAIGLERSYLYRKLKFYNIQGT